MKKILSILLFIAAAATSVSSAEGVHSLLLADSEALLDGARDHLTEVIDVMSSDIESDYLSRTMITGEGNRIAFDDLFHRRSLQGATALQQLQQEYAPETITLIWIESEKVHENKAYGVKKSDLRLRLRIVDPVTGRTVVDRGASYKPRFKRESADEEEREEARRALLAKAVSEFDLKRVGRSMDHYLQSARAMGNKIRVVIQGVDQKEYFEWRDGLLSMVESAGLVGDLRDHYDEAQDTLTIRGESGKEVPDFFRSLYHSTMGSEILDNFDISRSGKVIELKELPADTRRLVISGLSPDRYHNRLGIYRSALEAVEGVRGVEHSFVGSDDAATLVFTFISTEDLPVVEERLWRALRKAGKVPNRELVSISGNAIQYRVGEAAGDVNRITVVINNIAPGDYRSVGAAMDKIIKQLNVTGLEKSYSREDFQLKYQFVSPQRAADLDSTIWEKVTVLTDLEKIVQDSGRGNVLGYFFNQDRGGDRQQIVVTVRQVSPADYARAGRMLISTVQQIEGVERFSHDYSEEEQVINMTFLYRGENAYSIDGVIWDRVEQNSDLAGLTTGLIEKDSLEYLFGADPGTGGEQVVIVMKGVSGKEYKHISTAFSKLLKSVRNVESVRYGYSVRRRTITFRLQYSGEGLFALEDAIQLGLLKDDLLKEVERGADHGGRLVYRYGATEEDEEDAEEDSDATAGGGGASSSLINRLDKSVVYILVSGKEGVSEGTGFFVSRRGHILTNAHVVMDGVKFMVKTLDGERHRAEVIDANPLIDVALLKVTTPEKNFPATTIGNSDKLNKGDPILMIGNPLGAEYEHTVLSGIISGLDRQNGSLQLSIPSYPGSSGSPVFDRKGRVVGVMMARAVNEESRVVELEKREVVLTTHEAVENIGLAIPINYTRPMLGMVK